MDCGAVRGGFEMPIKQVKGGYKVQGTKNVHKTKSAAVRQLAAIKANQTKKGK